ncbi:hypothetical protein KPA07_11030, partial [Corynebacterium aurimucosum]|nr:hypothetical protein [Corynebacterium aurimucosum]
MKVNFVKRSLSTLAAIAIAAASVVLPMDADVAIAAAADYPKSDYPDANELGRNYIGEESYQKLAPAVTGGNETALPGDDVSYEYDVKTGFPADPDPLVAQRWIKFEICQAPEVPFKDAPTAEQLGLKGAPGFSIEKTGADCWTVVAGAEYAQNGDFKPNNDKNESGVPEIEYEPATNVWYPPATLNINIPATVKDTVAEGSTHAGNIHFLSGRLVNRAVQQKDEIEFVRNNGDGSCVAHVTDTASVSSDQIGYWINALEVYSDPQSTEYYDRLHDKTVKPELIAGTVSMNGTKLGDLNKVAWTYGEKQIASFELKPYGEEPIYADSQPEHWIKAGDEIVVDFEFLVQCDENVDDFVMTEEEEKQRKTAYAEHHQLDFYMSRPPEDATADATFGFTIQKPGEPEFAVEKSTTDGDFTITPDESNSAKITRNYTVKVTNTGTAEGDSAAVYDIPATPDGFTIAKVTVDGVEVQPEASGEHEGEYLVTDKDTLAARADKEHTVVVDYTIDFAKLTKDSISKLGECKAEGSSVVDSHGLYNKVTMEGDSDGQENNDACTQGKAPKFRVEKALAEGQEQRVIVDKDNKFTVDYTVTVTNDGTVAGTFDDIKDSMTFPEGFSGSVKVDGVKTDTIKGEKLQPGESKDYTITLDGTVTPPDTDGKETADWKTASEACEADEDGSVKLNPRKGIYNQVVMGKENLPDGDGIENNDACVNVFKPGFKVEKGLAEGQAGQIELDENDEFEVKYLITVTNTGNVAG